MKPLSRLKHVEITSLLAHVKSIKNKPAWNECEKRILAWAISTDGSIGLGLRRNNARINATFSSTEEDLVNEFYSIVQFGAVYKHRPSKSAVITRAEWFWTWKISSLLEVGYFLSQIAQFFPSQKTQKIANLIIEFVESREKRGAAYLQRLPLSPRERQIAEEVMEINRTKKTARLSIMPQKKLVLVKETQLGNYLSN